MLDIPFVPQNLVALGPLRGFAKAQTPLSPRKGVAQTSLGFTLLLARAQAEAEGDFLVLDVEKVLEALRHMEMSPGAVTGSRFSSAVSKTGPGQLQSQEALPRAACSLTVEVMRCTSPHVGHSEGQQLPLE